MRGRWAGLALLLEMACALWASGPRYVTGPPFFTVAAGKAVGWKQANLLYYTDPGDLGPAVNHAAADALVAAAAGVWNVPVASISVGQGGELAEHVSGQDAYLSSNGMVWPADVASGNAGAIPVAIVYDTDGSVTETLLGAGASDPAGCGQNAVTESVDGFDPAGYILHAIVVVNGRCTGTDPEQQWQLQYQLERVFGRVLGLAWSQTNDNVFTGTPTPNSDEALHWPIMHPMDILCGPYSYQCLPKPFELRPDDVAGLVGVYPIAKGTTPAAGKQVSLAAANGLSGVIAFPTGEGMEGVNVLVRRAPRFSTVAEDWIETSAVSGSGFRRAGVSPFAGADASAMGSMGTTAALNQGYYFVPYVAVTDPTGAQTEIVTMEPVNPLYVGGMSVGPYAPGMVAEAGSAAAPYTWVAGSGPVLNGNFAIADAPSTCGNGTDGTAAAPMTLPATGWWNGLVCGYGHASYVAAAVKAGRSLTVEVTALDGNGFATTTKLMPVMGLFAATDGAGSLPSLGVAAGAFNGLGVGTTRLAAAPFASGGAGGLVRLGIADERGDGRPDFAYQARLFYADSLMPATVAASGAVENVTVAGTGFRAGNTVSVNGVQAVVVSWSATAIVMTPPTLAAANAVAGSAVDVVVADLGTGATSTMSGALTYGSPGKTMQVVSAPTGTVSVGTAAGVPFAVQVLASDGVTPVAGDAVVFSATAGQAVFGVCGNAVCSVVTDGNGMASTGVSPSAAGTVTVQAADGGVTASASFIAQVQAASMTVVSAPSGNLPVGVAAAKVFQVKVLGASGASLAGQLVTFSVTAGAATLGGCNASACSVTTNQYGQATVQVTPTAVGAVTLTATLGSLVQQVSFTAVANADEFVVLTPLPATAYVKQDAGNWLVRLLKADGVTPVAYVPVVFSGPPGVSFSACAGSSCVVDTGYDGGAATQVTATAAGVYTVQVAYGSVTMSTTLTVTARPPKTLSIVSAPADGSATGSVAATPFSVQMLDSAGKPLPLYELTLGAPLGSVRMGCKTGSCVLLTDANGMASTTVEPLVPGTITLEATALTLDVTTSFVAVGTGESLTTVSAPAANVSVGDTVTWVLQSAGGVSSLKNRIVWLVVNGGTLALKGCQSTECKLYTNAQGMLTIQGTADVPGLVSMVVNSDGLTQTVSFLVSAKVYGMNVVSAPAGNYLVGTAVTPAFAVQVVGADGVTPASGQNVTFSLGSGSAGIAACPVMPCAVVTNAQGMASTGAITSVGTGPVTLVATDNAMSATASFVVMPNAETMTALEPMTYVAEGATVAMPVEAAAAKNGSAAVGQAVVWTGGAGFGLSAGDSVTNAAGDAMAQATLGPLAGGGQATGSACAWTTVCAAFQAWGVGAGALQAAVARGGQQTATGGAALAPVVAQVTDGAGHPVAGASVTVGQTVTALDVACPAQGRCPAAPVLASGESVVVSDLKGEVSVVPMGVAGTATMTSLAFSVGTQGFATAQVSSTP